MFFTLKGVSRLESLEIGNIEFNNDSIIIIKYCNNMTEASLSDLSYEINRIFELQEIYNPILFLPKELEVEIMTKKELEPIRDQINLTLNEGGN